MTECSSGAVGLVLAEDLRGEGRVVAEPSLCECVVKRLECQIADLYVSLTSNIDPTLLLLCYENSIPCMIR